MLFTFSLVVISSPALSETKTFIKEYTYQASEADSKVSCRVIALEQVKRLLLEELGTYLQSETEIKDFKLTRDQITVLTAGVVRTDIMNEKWDGKSYWFRARIQVNPDEVVKEIDLLRKDRLKTKELEDIRKKAEEALQEIERLKKEFEKAKGDKEKEAKYSVAVNELSAKDYMEKAYKSFRSKNYKEAVDYTTKAIELDPKYAKAFVTRGNTYYMLKDYDKAIKDVKKAIEMEPENRGGRCVLALVYANGLNNYQKAIEEISYAINLYATDDQHAGDYSFRGDLNKEIRKFKEALDDYNKAIELDPTYEDAYRDRADLNVRIFKEAELALKDMNTVVKLNPKSPKAYAGRAYVFKKLERFKDALEDYSKAISLNPQKEEKEKYYLERGDVYLELNDYKKAFDDYNRVIKKNPKYADAYYYRGYAFHQRSQYDKAIADLNKAISLNSLESNYFNARGDCYHLKGATFIDKNQRKAAEKYFKLARQDYLMAIKLNPNNASALANMAGLATEDEESLGYLNKAIELEPTIGSYYTDRAFIFKSLGEREKAYADLNKACDELRYEYACDMKRWLFKDEK